VGDRYTKKYEKTPKGFVMRAYRNMQSRVTGVQTKKAHLYKGLTLLDRQEFYSWALDDSEFRRLYKRWVETGYEHRLTPSINRIDSNKGYTLDNLEWVTHSVNSSLGGASSKRRHVRSLLEVYEHVG
jgi:hypothetical protein